MVWYSVYDVFILHLDYFFNKNLHDYAYGLWNSKVWNTKTFAKNLLSLIRQTVYPWLCQYADVLAWTSFSKQTHDIFTEMNALS